MTSINRTCQYCGRGGVYPPDGDYDFAHKGCHDQHLIDDANYTEDEDARGE